MQAEEAVEQRDHGRDERELGLEVALPAAPVDTGVERKERPVVEVPRHRRGVQLPPGVRVEERGGDVVQAQGSAQREDEKKREPAARGDVAGAARKGNVGLTGGGQDGHSAPAPGAQRDPEVPLRGGAQLLLRRVRTARGGRRRSGSRRR